MEPLQEGDHLYPHLPDHGASSMANVGQEDEGVNQDPHLPILGASSSSSSSGSSSSGSSSSSMKDVGEEDEEVGPDPRLPKRGAASMADVDRHCGNYDPFTIQIDVDRSTRLVDAVAIFERMQPGVRVKGQQQVQVFNPERIVLKVEAEAAMRAAVARMENSIGRVNQKIERTRQQAHELESLLQLGASSVAVGPSINQRAMDQHQVIYPSHLEMPEDAVGPERRISKKQKLKLRQAEGVFRL